MIEKKIKRMFMMVGKRMKSKFAEELGKIYSGIRKEWPYN